MTEKEMKNIINELCPWESLKKNQGITEFYVDANEISIGVSYEDIDELNDIYIYNLFYKDEYINISGYGTIENRLPEFIVQELADSWNSLNASQSQSENDVKEPEML